MTKSYRRFFEKLYLKAVFMLDFVRKNVCHFLKNR